MSSYSSGGLPIFGERGLAAAQPDPTLVPNLFCWFSTDTGELSIAIDGAWVGIVTSGGGGLPKLQILQAAAGTAPPGASDYDFSGYVSEQDSLFDQVSSPTFQFWIPATGGYGLTTTVAVTGGLVLGDVLTVEMNEVSGPTTWDTVSAVAELEVTAANSTPSCTLTLPVKAIGGGATDYWRLLLTNSSGVNTATLSVSAEAVQYV